MFRNFIDKNNLVDLGFSGYPCTWSNRRKGQEFVKLRLDRVLASERWIGELPLGCVKHLDSLGSDHRMLLLQPTVQRAKFSQRFV